MRRYQGKIGRGGGDRLEMIWWGYAARLNSSIPVVSPTLMSAGIYAVVIKEPKMGVSLNEFSEA